jgi:hypothetical protein
MAEDGILKDGMSSNRMSKDGPKASNSKHMRLGQMITMYAQQPTAKASGDSVSQLPLE